jgi:hypothetical protein
MIHETQCTFADISDEYAAFVERPRAFAVEVEDVAAALELECERPHHADVAHPLEVAVPA